MVDMIGSARNAFRSKLDDLVNKNIIRKKTKAKAKRFRMFFDHRVTDNTKIYKDCY
jgi:hypothetical protein